MGATDYGDCTKLVHDGGRSVGMHRCPRTATGPDGYCTQHRNAQKSGTREEAAVGPVTVKAHRKVNTSWEVGHGTPDQTITERVTMEWPKGQGPVFPCPYRVGDHIWAWVSIKRQGDRLSYDARGWKLRKDGTPADQVVDPGWVREAHLPGELVVELKHLLVEVHGPAH